MASLNNKASSEDLVQKALKEQLETHVEQLKKQVKELRDENETVQKKCHDFQEYAFSPRFPPFPFEVKVTHRLFDLFV